MERCWHCRAANVDSGSAAVDTLLSLAHPTRQVSSIVGLWYPATCDAGASRQCARPAFSESDLWDVHVHVSTRGTTTKTLAWSRNSTLWSMADTFALSLPAHVGAQKPLTLTVTVSPSKAQRSSVETAVATGALTRFMIPIAAPNQSLWKSEINGETLGATGSEVRHVRDRISVRCIHDTVNHMVFGNNMAPEGTPVRLVAPGRYGVYCYIDELALSRHDWRPVGTNATTVDVGISVGLDDFCYFQLTQLTHVPFKVQPISLGLFRLMTQFSQALGMLQRQFGFTEKEVDDVKQMLSVDNLHLLALTYCVSFLHAFFEFLAFKVPLGFNLGGRHVVTVLGCRTTFSFTGTARRL
jgi:hypothetical protein